MKDLIKPLIGILAFVALALVIAFFLTNNSADAPDTSESDSPSIVSEKSADQRPRAPKPDPKEDFEPSDARPQKPVPDFDEDDIAILVDGNPLVVTLLNYPELGHISIEEYSDEDEGFTGKPLKSGTKVQIPDPNQKGERIQFIVP